MRSPLTPNAPPDASGVRWRPWSAPQRRAWLRPGWHRLLVVLLLGVALGLRLWGSPFGLPFLYHPDEPAYVLQALAIARGLPGGVTFANPPLFKEVLLGVYGLDYAIGRLSGTYGSANGFVDQFRADPSHLYLLARWTSALLGTATVGVVYGLGRLVRGPQVGLLAAGLASVCYLLVREAHFGTNDTLVALCATAGLLGCVRVVCRGARADYVLAGAALGLAFAAKYQGAIVLVPLVVAHLLGPRPRHHGDLLLALATGAVISVVAFPWLVLEPARVLSDVDLHLLVPARSGYDGLDPAGGYVFYARTLGLGLGWLLLGAAAVGVGRAWSSRDRALLVVAALPIALVASLGASALYFARFVLPAVPALLVLGAAGLDAPRERWCGRLRPGLPGLLTAGLVGLVGLPSLIDSARFDVLLTRDDTRTLARQWVQTALPAQARLAVDAPPLGPPLDGLPQAVLVANDWSLDDLSLDDYRQRGVDYLVTSSFVAEARAVEPDREARRRTFYAALEQSAHVVAEFRPAPRTDLGFVYDRIYGPFDQLDAFQRPGPTITVLRLDAGDRSP